MTNSMEKLKAQLQVLMSLKPDETGTPKKLQQYLTGTLETDKIASLIKRLLAEYNAYLLKDTINNEVKELNKNIKGLTLNKIPKDATPDKVYEIFNKNKESIKKHKQENEKKREKAEKSKEKLTTALKQASLNELEAAIKTLDPLKGNPKIAPLLTKYKEALKKQKEGKEKKKKKKSETIAASAKQEEERAELAKQKDRMRTPVPGEKEGKEMEKTLKTQIAADAKKVEKQNKEACLLYTSPSPRD